ncbi:MAG: BrnT family toxin [Elusimicrobia bacterium]|nr:BrnT family toxin [Elusimicrobiota bacterium]
MELLVLPFEFEWDQYNMEHVRLHKVEPSECERVFFNIPFTIEPDIIHSKQEKRYFALGKTNRNRILVVIFTIRNRKIRIITTREANKKERRKYEA